jgi:hypothetical protein
MDKKTSKQLRQEYLELLHGKGYIQGRKKALKKINYKSGIPTKKCRLEHVCVNQECNIPPWGLCEHQSCNPYEHPKNAPVVVTGALFRLPR